MKRERKRWARKREKKWSGERSGRGIARGKGEAEQGGKKKKRNTISGDGLGFGGIERESEAERDDGLTTCKRMRL